MKQDKFYYSDGSTSSELDYSKQLHRVDGPAVEYVSEYKAWYFNGEYHRVDGPAVELANGSKAWYFNGEYHRVDGPAIEYSNGAKEWYLNGRHHRIDGPAIEYSNGAKHWFIDSEYYSEKEFNDTIKEVNEMCIALLLTDPREWVREMGRKRIKE